MTGSFASGQQNKIELQQLFYLWVHQGVFSDSFDFFNFSRHYSIRPAHSTAVPVESTG